jgi:hypothetical protein
VRWYSGHTVWHASISVTPSSTAPNPTIGLVSW